MTTAFGTMRAARIHAYGPTDVFAVEDAPRPVVKPNDVLVRIHATSVNPVDCKMRSGSHRGAIRRKLPTILGMDVSGVIVEVGGDVTGFAVGDAVFSSPTHKREGTYAEYIAIDAAEVAKKPANISHAEAATLPLVGLTAWRCLVTAGKVQPGEKVLIQAGSGGVGSFAVQLAKHLGAEVSTTCSTRNVALCESLGADRVVDYTKEQFEDVLPPQDMVLEALGGDVLKRSLKSLRKGGRLIGINAGMPKQVKRFGPYLGLAAVGIGMLGLKLKSRLTKHAKASIVTRSASGAELAEISALVEAGVIKPVVDKTFPLDAIAEAHAYSETGRARGKIAIQVVAEEG